jgi:hypothetical protein
MLTEARLRERRFAADRELFARNFDRAAFVFAHRLADHPLFTPDRLLDLAKRMAEDPRDVYYDAGDVRVDQRWDEVAACDLPVDEILRRIETAGAWVVLRQADKDPAYAALLDECLTEIEALAGKDLAAAMKLRRALIFVNSPNRISSYHIDRECNFLLQISGTKTIHVFDRYDRDVLPEEEIERFWTVDNNAALYKPQYADRAQTFVLRPGEAVHLPVNAPHWVQNGPEVSVSLSINFHYHDAALADVYRANYWLRRLGFRPSPPERFTLADNAKRTAFACARSLKRAGRRLSGRA